MPNISYASVLYATSGSTCAMAAAALAQANLPLASALAHTGRPIVASQYVHPVVFGYDHRDGDNRHTAIIEGPLEMIRTGDAGKDIVANTAMLTRKIEDAIRDDPEQWVWMHRRWRRQP